MKVFQPPLEILLVEDSPSDAMMTREALELSKVRNNLHVVTNGVEAMDFLRRKGKYAGSPRPGLVLLDWNLPKKSGKEVLEEIKEDAQLHLIPVVVLSTSKAEQDILQSYGLNASCYITKPVDFSQFYEVVQSIHNFWFTVVTLPPDVQK